MKHPVIILEGPDGSGKTWVAKKLHQELGFRYLHEGVPPPGTTSAVLFSHYLSTLWKALRGDRPVVLDRHYLGELIYGPVMRQRSLLSETQRRLIERLVFSHGAKVVICEPELLTCRNNWLRKRRDYVPDMPKLSLIWGDYRRRRVFNPRYHRWDYEHDSWDLLREIVTLPRVELGLGILGSPTAQVLLVGEQVNVNLMRRDWPFFSEQGSSGYLNQALQQALIPEEHLAIVNILPPESLNPKDLTEIKQQLPQLRQVVALGRVAEEALTHQQVEHTHLPHPQFHKRFNHNVEAYAQQLKEAYETRPELRAAVCGPA